MNNKMFLLLSFFVNILFLNIKNPLVMGILMLIQTFLLILMMGKIYFSFWFSYIIFLIFIGGLFILFIYMISLTYNNKYMLMKYLNMIFYLILTMILFKYLNMLYLNNYEINNFNLNKLFYLKENKMFTIKFYNFPNNMINLMMIIYLFLLMVIVVKITNFFKGPIRTIK